MIVLMFSWKNILLKSCFPFILVNIFETPSRALSKPWVPYLNKHKSFFLGYLFRWISEHTTTYFPFLPIFLHWRQLGPLFKLNESPVFCAKIGWNWPHGFKGWWTGSHIPTTDRPKKFWSEKLWHLSLQLRRANKNKITGFFSFWCARAKGRIT